MVTRGRDLEAIPFEGLRIFDYTDYTAGLGAEESGASLARIEVPPGAVHREAYSRRSDKLYLLVRGEVAFELGGDEILLETNDFVRVVRGQRFSYRNRSADLAVFILVHTPSFDLESEVFTEPGTPPNEP